ncbi:hypothetical protein RB201_27950 [Streptomyces sp. S1A(2023)]
MSNTDQISEYIVREFLPDLTPSQLPHDLDLLADGALDSLGVLKLIAWVEHHFRLAVGDSDLDPDNFRSVNAIDAYIARSRSRRPPGRLSRAPGPRPDHRPARTGRPGPVGRALAGAGRRCTGPR